MAAEKEISVAGTVTTNEWSDRAVVVTGAAGGIGKGIVAALLEAGAKLVLSDAHSDQLDHALRSFDVPRDRLSSFVANICDEAQVNALAEHVLERFGKLYGWVNNAGTIELGPALETTRTAVLTVKSARVVYDDHDTNLGSCS